MTLQRLHSSTFSGIPRAVASSPGTTITGPAPDPDDAPSASGRGEGVRGFLRQAPSDRRRHAYCVRAPLLFHELPGARDDGSYTRTLARLATTDLLLIEGWGLTALTSAQWHDLLEVLETRGFYRTFGGPPSQGGNRNRGHLGKVVVVGRKLRV